MRIAVTGIGIVSAVGFNCSETLASLLGQRPGIAPMRYLGSLHTGYPVGEVPCSNNRLGSLAGTGNELLPRTALLGIIAAREAAEMAHAKCDALISGTTVGGMDLTEQHLAALGQGTPKGYRRDTEGIGNAYAALHEAGASADAIAAHLSSSGLLTPSFVATPSTACSSALNAVMLGADLLRTGQVRRALVGGAESLSLFHFNGFRTLMILDREPCRPFSADRNGLNLGEGAGYLVIESEADALARGAAVLGYIGGYANTCDAYHQTASSPDGEGAFLAMKGALKMAGLKPEDIDYVNAHGTATPNNDLSESAALMRLFGSSMPPVSSTKAFTGHTTSASGGIEAVISLLAMNNGFIPANLGWKQTAEGLVTPVPHTLRQPVHNLLCNAFGFGGNESSLVLCDHPVELSEASFAPLPVPVACLHQPPAVTLVSASEARRMTPQMRQLVSVARKALSDAGIEKPDAIVCATRWGCMMQSMRFLQDMLGSGEQDLKPTPFIQSTHNTVASLLAVLTGNHGYNSTYSQGSRSLECALTDIRCQMALGRISSALVLEFDEQVEAWDRHLLPLGEKTQNIARARVYVK